jgi:glycosyltransferase involved in cell wall biosynthesis
MTVDILMATFNGERYLRNQLLSLQQQSYEDWILWIRDDGSTDNTMHILSKFAGYDNRIKIVEEGSKKRLGPGRNFLGLTRYSTADYVIFCDQDDIWFEKKLEILIDFAKKKFVADIPCLVYCDAYGYSDREGLITINGVATYHAKSLREFLFFNSGYQGCSMLFNQRLCKMAAEYRADYFYMHDDVISLLAHSFGQVYFLPKKLMLYRQHASKVTRNIDPSLWSYLKRIFNKNLYVLSVRHYKEKESFFYAYKDDLDNEARQLFTAYLAFPDKKLCNRLFLIIRYGFSLGGNKYKLLFKTIIRRPIG